MATLKLTLLKAKALKDGTHKIRIAVSHKSETTYIITRFIVEENQFKNGQVVRRPDASIINKKLRGLLDEYQDRLDGIKHQNLYTCAQLKNILESKSATDETLTFQKVSSDYENELRRKGSVGYANLIEANRRLFTEYVEGDFCITDINIGVIEGFSDFLRTVKHHGETMNGMQMRHVRTVINRAIKKRLVTFDVNPFLGFVIPSPEVREIDLSLESLNRIRSVNLTDKPLRAARDMFMLSFYLGGMNLIDILDVDFRKESVSYVRTKTATRTHGNKTISFTVPKEAKEIAETWISKTGKIDLGYKFEYKNLRTYINRELHKVADCADVNERIMFYSARKTFAQFASDLGIPDGIIDYCLGHSDKSKGVIRYYTKVRQKQADMAIARVIDYINNPDKYKEYIELRSDIMLMRG